MEKVTVFCLFAFVFLVSENVKGHSYSLGTCPNVDPMPDFEMKKMLGIWYVIQKTSTASSCIIYNYTKTDEPGEYKLEQISQNPIIGLTPVDHEYHYTGILSVPDSSVPARMTVKFPLNVAGSASYTVLLTDYENYAAIFTCQKLAFAHRQSATILSRERTLEKLYMDKIRQRLSSFNIDPYDLSIISQKDCPKNKNKSDEDKPYNINIDENTFSAKNIKDTLKKAGEKIGDGFKYVADGAKKIYDKITSDEEGESTTVRAKIVTAHPDSEWLP